MTTTYKQPAVRLTQVVETSSSSSTTDLAAFVFGPDYRAMTYDNATTKAKIGLGNYNFESEAEFAWPNKPTGAVVDTSWTTLFMDSAWLRYFTNASSGEVIKAVTGYPNRIRCTGLALATANGVNRASALAPRNVTVGDGIRIKATVNGTNYSFDTKVSSLIADTAASAVNSMEEDEDNTKTASASAVVTLASGSAGTVTTTASAAAYDGSASGRVKETYVLTVATPGAFGTATLAVTSTSGTDNMASVITPASGVASAIGTRGATITFTTATGTPFVAGQSWTVDVTQAWAAAEITSETGTYTGSKDGTYIVTVTAGGKWGGALKAVVTSTGTLDNSGPYDVSTKAKVITLPTGVKFSLGGTSATGLIAGDRYYINVTAAASTGVYTLTTANSLPDWVFNIFDADDVAAPVALTAELAMIRNLEVPAVRTSTVANYTSSVTAFTVAAGITGTDSTWKVGGALVALPVIKAGLYVQYRALSPKYNGDVFTVSTVDDVYDYWDTADVTPNNPLAYGVYMAALGAAGAPVRFSSVESDNLAGYVGALEVIYDRNDVYSLVPMTKEVAVWDAVYAHAMDASSAERNRWRVCWFNAFVNETTAVVVGNPDPATCLVSDDPDVPGTGKLLVTSTNGDFITNKVAAGDSFRVNYGTNAATGEETYETYVVDSVLTEEQLRLASGPANAVNIESRFEIWHTNSVTEQANQVVALASHFSSSRVQMVWPDSVEIGGASVSGIYLVAYLAGLRGGQKPHQGLTFWELSGFGSVNRTKIFTGTKLNLLASHGVWIVNQNSDGAIIVRHQLTTDPTDVATRESSKVSNRDSLSYRYYNFFVGSKYIGRTNINAQLLNRIRADFAALRNTVLNEGAGSTLGAQFVDAELTSLTRDTTNTDCLTAVVSITDQDPFNGFDITLKFSSASAV